MNKTLDEFLSKKYLTIREVNTLWDKYKDNEEEANKILERLWLYWDCKDEEIFDRGKNMINIISKITNKYLLDETYVYFYNENYFDILNNDYINIKDIRAEEMYIDKLIHMVKLDKDSNNKITYYVLDYIENLNYFFKKVESIEKLLYYLNK